MSQRPVPTSPIGSRGEESPALLQELRCLCVLAAHQGFETEGIERRGDISRVSDLSAGCERLFAQRYCLVVVALRLGQGSSRSDRPGPDRAVGLGAGQG